MTSQLPELAPSQPLRRRPLHDEVAEWLRNRISEDAFPPGTIIPEVAVSDQLGLSRTPVREALKVLASERLVEIVPAQGARVVALTPREVEDMVVVLARLEALAAELAGPRLDFDGLAALEALHERMSHHFERRNRSAYFPLNLEFHRLIVVASGNTSLLDTWTSYSNRVRRIRYLSSMDDQEWRASVSDHAEIIALLKAKRPRTAARLIERHVRGVWATLAAGAAKVARPPAASGERRSVRRGKGSRT